MKAAPVTASLLFYVSLHLPAADDFADFDDFDDFDQLDKALAVNEGELRILPEPPATAVHRHRNSISITARSLQDGWVGLRQCHSRLDPVPALEIRFNPETIRGIEILSRENVERAYSQGASVQLEGVGRDARLCLKAQSRALHPGPDGVFELRNGPYMRRFLDGYYPLHLLVEVHFPQELTLVSMQPEPQPGLTIRSTPGRLVLEGWFEGRLFTIIRFRSAAGTTDAVRAPNGLRRSPDG